MTINDWLKETSAQLADAMIPSARLDAEVILAHTLNKPRTWLHAHTDDELDPRRRDIADARVALRLERVPVAYIIGHKEFYGRRFNVTTDTLIPRPESEEIIAQLDKWLTIHPDAKHLIDIGTGSGALGITAALEHPQLSVTLSDISAKALKVATKNAELHKAKVTLIESDLLDKYPLRPHVILANLPYIDSTWTTSPEVAHEPDLALYASNGGLELTYRLIDQAEVQLAKKGVMILEADPRQHKQIIDYARLHSLGNAMQNEFVITLER